MATVRKSLFLHGLTAAFGIACALAVPGAVQKFSQPSPPAGYVANRDGHTTVYAPSAAAARRGQEDVGYARSRFQALFGTEPSDLVVFLTDDPAELRGLDLDPLRPKGSRLLPFVTEGHLSTSVVHSHVPGRVPGGEMVPARLLAHETCHVYVSEFTDRVAGKTHSQGRYGHHALPDWFDEAAATLCESAEARAERNRYFYTHLDERIPLQRFHRMTHPLGGADVLERLGVEVTPGRAAVHVLTADRISAALPDVDHVLFYAQALSLGEFIAERGGPGALGSLTRPLAKGQALEQALTEARRTAPALPATVQVLETEWIRWVVRQGQRDRTG